MAPKNANLPGSGDDAPIAGTMAEAPTHDLGKSIEVKPTCNQDSYMKLDVDTDAPFAIGVETMSGCASIAVLNANGGIASDSIEVCEDAPATLEATGQDTTFVSISETGACTGNTVVLTPEAR